MAKSRHKKIVVEGVETKEQFTIIAESGSDYIQGYYFARPMEADELIQIAGSGSVLPIDQNDQ